MIEQFITGIQHIGIPTNDMHTRCAFLNSALWLLKPTKIIKLCIKVVSAIQNLPFWGKGIKFFKIEGPNKELIEFCQIL
ncbi:MAG: hypothetical protein LBT13_09150 [Treponema sp.]|jgi:hypothetical protein|nr:hypothetical protein [Treponema sp.]